MSRIKKIWEHLKNGTVKERIKYQFSGLKKWEEMKAGKRKFVIHPLTGKTKIKLYPDSYLSFLILRGDFENTELSFVERILRPNDQFYDIGANIGIFSLIASEKGCRIHSFEPTPITYQRLVENMHLNGYSRVKTHHLALSDSTGRTLLNVSDNGMDAWNNLSGAESEEGFKKVEIATSTLDDFIASNQPAENDFIFLKMDVEGWEWNVLKGADNFLKTYSPVWMIEFNDENFIRNNYKGKDLINFMKEKGYTFYEIINNRLSPHTTLEDYGYMNLIAAKDISVLQSRI